MHCRNRCLLSHQREGVKGDIKPLGELPVKEIPLYTEVTHEAIWCTDGSTKLWQVAKINSKQQITLT